MTIKDKRVVYLVDYENVGPSKFCEFISRVDALDRVFVFYSGTNNTINFDDLRMCECRLDFIKINNGTKNALDFQLISFMGYCIAKNEEDPDHVFNYVIVSDDKGFGCLSAFWRDEQVNVRTMCVSENVSADTKASASKANKKSKKGKKNKKISKKARKKLDEAKCEEKERVRKLNPITYIYRNIDTLAYNCVKDDRSALVYDESFKTAFEHEFGKVFEPIVRDKWKQVFSLFLFARDTKRFESKLLDGELLHPDLARYVMKQLRNSDIMAYMGCRNPKSDFYNKLNTQ